VRVFVILAGLAALVLSAAVGHVASRREVYVLAPAIPPEPVSATFDAVVGGLEGFTLRDEGTLQLHADGEHVFPLEVRAEECVAVVTGLDGRLVHALRLEEQGPSSPGSRSAPLGSYPLVTDERDRKWVRQVTWCAPEDASLRAVLPLHWREDPVMDSSGISTLRWAIFAAPMEELAAPPFAGELTRRGLRAVGNERWARRFATRPEGELQSTHRLSLATGAYLLPEDDVGLVEVVRTEGTRGHGDLHYDPRLEGHGGRHDALVQTSMNPPSTFRRVLAVVRRDEGEPCRDYVFTHLAYGQAAHVEAWRPPGPGSRIEHADHVSWDRRCDAGVTLYVVPRSIQSDFELRVQAPVDTP